jgi:uncharacterized protein (TIGR02246 family)
MRTGKMLSGRVVGMIAAGIALINAAGAQEPARPNRAPENDSSSRFPAAERPIHDAVAAFTRAFNAGNAHDIAQLFTDDARLTSADGSVFEGRAAIEHNFAETFQAHPGLTIEVHSNSIRFVTPDVAIEEGTTKVHVKDGGSPEISHYTAVHVQRDGRWLQASVRDHPAEALRPHDRLQELEWMVGEWVNESPQAIVHTSCRWSEDQNFLIREFHVKIHGAETLSGVQRIGWDPLHKQIRSWVFDSDGGFGDGLWSRHGNQWVIKANGVRPDGTTASSTNIITLISKDVSQWKLADRTLSGHVVPNVDEFIMVRKPPQPR